MPEVVIAVEQGTKLVMVEVSVLTVYVVMVVGAVIVLAYEMPLVGVPVLFMQLMHSVIVTVETVSVVS